MKRIISGFLSLVFVLGCLNGIIFPAKANGVPEGLQYSISNGEVTITDYTGSATDLEIPETIEGYPVTIIGKKAFYYCGNLTSITIPDGVTSIGGYAFSGCSSLESITIPFVGDSIKTPTDTYQYPFGYIFGESSYTGGTATTQRYYDHDTSYTRDRTYYIPSSLKSVTVTGGNILYGAFDNCSGLTSITIGDGVTSIGSQAFDDCSSLTSVTIGDGVTSIGTWAFFDCSNLDSVSIGKNVSSIETDAFDGCNSLTAIWVDEENSVFSSDSTGVLLNKELTEILFVPKNLTGYYVIPNSVTNIGRDIFSGCSSLTNITIPDSVTSIGGSAFYGCSSLTNITIPDSVTSIGGSAFYGCHSLQYNIYDNGKYLGNSVNPYLLFIESVNDDITTCKFSSGVRFIGSSAFYGCSSLTNITIPDSVTSIGKWAFSSCSGLTNITIPDSVTNIGDYVFSSCSSLTNITIPDSVTSIGGYAFSDCSSLTNITIPDSVTSIGEGAFYGCSGLTSITIPEGVTSIGYVTFEGCENLSTLTIPDSIEYVGYEAFTACSNLQYNIYDNAIYLGNSNNPYVVLRRVVDKSITSCIIHPDTKIICDTAFYGCENLTSIAIPAEVKMIGVGAFDNCTSLSVCEIADISAWCNVYFDAQLGVSNPLNMAESVYVKGELLTELVIPKDVTIIKDCVFSGCDSINSIRFKGDAPEIGSAFYGITAIAYYPIGNDTWTEDVMQDYAGNITWVPYEPYEPGDLDGVEGVDNRDVEYLLWYTLFPEDYPLPQAADFDSNGYVDNKDVEYLLWHTLFPEDYPL